MYHKEVVGIIPAAGKATRISPIPLSKEIYPIGFSDSNTFDSDGVPKGVCLYLLEKMCFAKAKKIYFVLRNGKWDVPAYLTATNTNDMSIAYLVTEETPGVPYTIDIAYPFISDAVVLFGFPDILFNSEDAFLRLLVRLYETKADVVLGLFSVKNQHKWDMVELDGDRIKQIFIKPEHTNLRYTWVIAVWTPKFTQFMHEYLKSVNHATGSVELYMSNIVQQAISNEIHTEAVLFPDDSCLDIGTPEDLRQAIKKMN